MYSLGIDRNVNVVARFFFVAHLARQARAALVSLIFVGTLPRIGSCERRVSGLAFGHGQADWGEKAGDETQTVGWDFEALLNPTNVHIWTPPPV